MNNVTLENDNTIHVRFNGKLDFDHVHSTLITVDQMVVAKALNSPRLLIDVKGLEEVKMDARRRGVEWLKRGKVSKIAVYGGKNLFSKYFIKLLIKILGMSSNMAFFKTRKDAVKWLNQ